MGLFIFKTSRINILRIFCVSFFANQDTRFLQGFFRRGKTAPTYFLFSLRQGIVGNHARRAELSEVLKK